MLGRLLHQRSIILSVVIKETLVAFDLGLASAVVKETVSLARERLSKKLDRRTTLWDEVFLRLDNYVAEVLQWSSRVQFFGMSGPDDVGTTTIPLRLHAEPRRFRSPGDRSTTITERDLLLQPMHTIILGEPGSGKTTSLKRLVRMILLEEPLGPSDYYRYPVVIRIRDHSDASGLAAAIAETIGIAYESVLLPEPSVRDPLPTDQRPSRRYRLTAATQPLLDVVAEFLDEADAVLMLDGFDEFPASAQSAWASEISLLSNKLNRAKIIITTRSGDFRRTIEGFVVLEICPLSQKEARALASKLVGNVDTFFDELARSPYSDLMDRPLLLTQLLILYKREGYLPQQPSQIYRRLTRLLLAEWDRERGLSRRSRYAGFDVDRKADFLAALAYRLTYRFHKTSFSLNDLVNVYVGINAQFELPAAEAEQVAEELASHTGLIVVTSNGFEFSHLSLQEYLCASHMVREAFPEELPNYIVQYPAALAVSVAISSSPATWFAGLVLKPGNWTRFSRTQLRSFMSRVLIERPTFDIHPALGLAAMFLHTHSQGDPGLEMDAKAILSYDPVRQSVASILGHYIVTQGSPMRGVVRLERLYTYENAYGLPTPETASLPADYIVQMLIKHETSLSGATHEGRRPIRVLESGLLAFK